MVQALPKSYFLDHDVVALSQDLLGKSLFTCFEGQITGGIIIETEAYRGPEDRASYAYGNRRTARNEVMYADGGVAYVYLCYGLHHLFNVVTATSGVPHAILIRAVQPTTGVEIMLARRNKKKADRTLCNGPGTVSQALGIDRSLNGFALTGPQVWISEGEVEVPPDSIISGPRIGVDYAGEDAKLSWHCRVQG